MKNKPTMEPMNDETATFWQQWFDIERKQLIAFRLLPIGTVFFQAISDGTACSLWIKCKQTDGTIQALNIGSHVIHAFDDEEEVYECTDAILNVGHGAWSGPPPHKK